MHQQSMVKWHHIAYKLVPILYVISIVVSLLQIRMLCTKDYFAFNDRTLLRPHELRRNETVSPSEKEFGTSLGDTPACKLTSGFDLNHRSNVMVASGSWT